MRFGLTLSLEFRFNLKEIVIFVDSVVLLANDKIPLLFLNLD